MSMALIIIVNSQLNIYCLPGQREVLLFHLTAAYKITSSVTPAINPPTMELMNFPISDMAKTRLIKYKAFQARIHTSKIRLKVAQQLTLTNRFQIKPIFCYTKLDTSRRALS